MEILGKLEKSKNFWFLLLSSFIFFLLRLPSLFEPYWYGDEGIYQVIGTAIRSGRLLYRDIWDNKPPLLYLLYSFFSSDQFTIRLASLIFGLLSIVVFFILAKKLFEENQKAIFISVSFFTLLFALPIIEGNIANAENFMILPILLAGLLIIDTQSLTSNKLLLSGFLLSIAFLFKIVAIFDMAAFLLFLIFIHIKERKKLVNLIPFIISFSIPILLTFLFFFLNGSLNIFLSAVFFQNVGYVNYGNQFLFPQGLLLLKTFLLASFAIFMFKKIEIIKKSTLFILLWFSFSLFNTFFSQRPYTHYLLVLLPSFSLLIGTLFLKRKFLNFLFLISIIGIILITKNFSFYGKTFSYYQNFITFIFNQKSVYLYRSFFDRQTPTDYDVAKYIKNRGEKNIFIWGNNAQLYKLADKLPPGKFIVAYHMTYNKESLEETKNAFYKQKPEIIVITSRNNPIPFSLYGYVLKLNVNKTSIYEKLF